MLEEYVRSLSRVQKEEPHTNQPTAMRGQSFRVKVVNNNLRISSLLFGLYVSIHGYFCGYMCDGGIFKTHLNINSQRIKYK